MTDSGTQGLDPAPSSVFDGQRFSDYFTPVGFVVFAAIGLSIALSMIEQGGGRSALVPALFVAVGLFGVLRATYQVVLFPDGTLEFKSILRTARTNIDDVNRVRYSRSPRGGASWEFYFDGTMRAMSTSAGRNLADTIAARNPSVQSW